MDGALATPPVPGLAAPAAATAPAAAAATAAPTPMVPPPAAQLAMRIAPLRLDADGIHRLTVNLHPVDLGPVQVVAEIRDGSISVQLTGTTEAGHESLREALGDLRRELEDAGFGNCSLDLRQGAAGDPEARRQFAAARTARGTATAGTTTGPAVEPAIPRITPAGGDRRLDLHV